MSSPDEFVSSQLTNTTTTTTLKLELLSQWLTDYFNNNSLVMSDEFLSWFLKCNSLFFSQESYRIIKNFF